MRRVGGHKGRCAGGHVGGEGMWGVGHVGRGGNIWGINSNHLLGIPTTYKRSAAYM